MYRNGFFARLIGAMLLIGLIAAGGYAAYRAGILQGTAQAPAVAQALLEAAESGQLIAPGVRPGVGYGYPYPFGFFSLGGICLSVFFVFLFFGLLRMVFCPWRPGRRDWGSRWKDGVPPMFAEWHRRAHEDPTTTGSEE